MTYKGYHAALAFDAASRTFRGTVEGVTPPLRFEGASVDALEDAFHEAVDAYLARCAETGEGPSPPGLSAFAGAVETENERSLLRDLFYGSEIAIFIVDVDAEAPPEDRFRFAALNPAHERLSGLGDAWIRGRTPAEIADVITPAGAEAVQANYQRCVDADAPISYEEMVPLDGRPTWWLTHLTPLRDGAGRVVRIVGSAVEFTEQKAAQDALREEKERAEGLRKLAEAASAAKSAFVATMSHEIRTPLNGVIGFAEILRSFDLEGEIGEFVGLIHRSGDTLLALVNDILDFSKIEAGELRMEERRFDLVEEVGEAMEAFALDASERGLELMYRIEPTVPTLLIGDPLRFRQVLSNLVGNALKFTHEGEVEVAVTSEPIADDVHELHVSVRDTGIGIDPSNHRELFDPFYQVDGSNTRAYGGTGLGLAICRRLADAMGGGVWVESRPGEGSTFHFTAVLRTEELVAFEPKPERIDLKGFRVLVVDDNATNRRLLEKMLGGWEMDVASVSNGQAALDRLGSEAFDVVLLDFHMPGMNGATAARRIRARYPAEALPLMLLSSADVKLDDEPNLFQAVMTKPIGQRRLRTLLERAVPRLRDEPAPDAGPALLVAEDQAANLRVTLAMLRRLGYRADAVSNGVQAIEAVEARPYEAVLMDVRMPVMDGITAAREIRKRHGGDRPYIIALTAQVLPGDRERCLEAGMNDYLSKPLRLPELHGVLERFEQRRAQTDG